MTNPIRWPLWLGALLLLTLFVAPADGQGSECGDGDLEGREECDDGNTTSGDGCDSMCREELDWRCNPAPCSHNCQCGDGFVSPWCTSHECDNGAGNSDSTPDSCRTSCLLPSCGDGVIDSDEECDDATGNSDGVPDTCRLDCRLARCGDGIRDSDEACDEGSANCDSSGCSCRTDCSFGGCGNSMMETGEFCEDGNTDNDDDCLATCIFNTCGDGFANRDVSAALLVEEICDPPGSDCRYDCGQDYSFCGNDIVEQGEGCDEGGSNSNAADADCREDCQERRCGDGVVDSDEECDRQLGCGPDCRWVF